MALRPDSDFSTSLAHGFQLATMGKTSLPLEDAYIESVYFDQSGNFAGLKIKDNKDNFFKSSSAELQSF